MTDDEGAALELDIGAGDSRVDWEAAEGGGTVCFDYAALEEWVKGAIDEDIPVRYLASGARFQ